MPNLSNIRRATAADVPAIGRLGALLMELHHAIDPARFLAATWQTADRYGEWIESQLAKPGIVVLVAERTGQIIGYAYAGMEGVDYMALRGPAGALYDIVVDPAVRGAGVGSLLLQSMLVELRSLGATQVVLSTAWQNESAQRLFARAGFRRTMIEMTRDS
jgi:ribosomal protein S18 acetylase RimI-like enzyme